jgi:general secretion pathway protein C
MLEFWLKALQVVLGLGALALVGTTLVSFASSSPAGEAPPSSIDAGQPQQNDASLPRYRVIADRNLFKLKEKPVPVPVEQSIEESKLQVQLLGTVVAQIPDSGDPEQGSLAIVRDTDGQVKNLAVGAEFAEKRAKLVRVEPRRIVLDQGGRLEAVQLVEEVASQPQGQARRPGTPASVPNMNAVQDIARNMAQASGPDAAMTAVFRQLGSQMVGSVERDANGRLAGFRVQRINEGSALQDVGLQPGDSIRGINGQSLSAEGAAVQLFASFSGGADARLTVQDQNGQSRELVLPRATLQRLMLQR